jgi:hypothetical protein
MAADADHFHLRHGRRLAVQARGVLIRHAELALPEPRRDVRMRLRVHVRVDAERDRRTLAELACDLRDALQLVLGLEVQAEDSRLERARDLRRGLAHAREQHLARVAAGGEHPRQLPARDDVEAGPEPREQRQHAEVRVGLDRIGHQRAAPGKGAREFAVMALDRSARVDVTRRAEAPRNVLERHLLGAQRTVAVGKIHARTYFFSVASSVSAG